MAIQEGYQGVDPRLQPLLSSLVRPARRPDPAGRGLRHGGRQIIQFLQPTLEGERLLLIRRLHAVNAFEVGVPEVNGLGRESGFAESTDPPEQGEGVAVRAQDGMTQCAKFVASAYTAQRPAER